MFFGIPVPVIVAIITLVSGVLAGTIALLKQRADLLAKCITELYAEWREITRILKAEREDISIKYVKKCEELSEATAELCEVRAELNALKRSLNHRESE